MLHKFRLLIKVERDQRPAHVFGAIDTTGAERLQLLLHNILLFTAEKDQHACFGRVLVNALHQSDARADLWILREQQQIGLHPPNEMQTVLLGCGTSHQ